MSIRTKIASLIVGEKGMAELQAPYKRIVDGKTYYNLSSLDPKELARFMSVLECGYTDYNLVELFYSIGEIFAPVDAIASRVAQATYQVKDLVTNEVVTTNKPLNELLTQPNPLQNWSQFMYESVCWEYLNGRNFIYANIPDTLSFDYKNVRSLQNLWSYAVTVLHDPQVKLLSATKIEDIIKGYRLAGYADMTPDKVLFNQFMSLDVNDKKVITSRSPLLSARRAIANLIAVYEARGSIYLNRGALGLLVSKVTDQTGNVPLTPTQKKGVIEDYNTEYGVTRGKSPIAITGVPMEWIRIAMSIAELLPFDETQADAAVIYGVLKVPELLMPTPKAGTFENQRIAERSLFQNVATPLAKSRAQAITNYLRLNDVGLYIDANHDHIEVLQDNRKEKAETSKIESEAYLIQYRSGVITMNDWIRKTGGKPVDSPLFNKRTLEMTTEEIAQIMPLLTARSNTGGGTGAN